MNIEVNNATRLSLNLNLEEARAMIQRLQAVVDQAEKTGGGWFATPVTVIGGDAQVNGRMTVRIES